MTEQLFVSTKLGQGTWIRDLQVTAFLSPEFDYTTSPAEEGFSVACSSVVLPHLPQTYAQEMATETLSSTNIPADHIV
jgi:hypothetical protein